MKLTGSSYGRAEICPPSTFLPRVESAGGEYAERGKAVHHFLLTASQVGRDAALALVEVKHRDTCAAINLEALPHAIPEGWAFEVAFGLNLETGTSRELWRGRGDRAYPEAQPGERFGTADVVGFSEVGGVRTITVLDVKTGHGDVDQLQLGFYAVAAAIAFDAHEATIGWIRLTDGTPRYSSQVIDLMEMRARLRNVELSAEEQEVDYEVTGRLRLVDGPHCRYCPAFARCPAKTALLGELARQSEAELVLPELTPETAPLAWTRFKAMEATLEKAGKWLREYARAHPFALPDGKVVGAIEESEETIVPSLAELVLPPEVFADARETKETLTKAALKRAAAKHLPEGEKVTRYVDGLLEKLRAAGAVTVSKSVEVRAFRPPKGATP